MKIVTDSAADMPVEELEALGITAAPLYIQFPEGEVASADLTTDAFYDRLEAMQPTIPTTSLPSSGEFAAIYRKVAQQDKDILSVHISSGLSGTLNAAQMGAEEARPEANVTIFDSMSLTAGERYPVLAAAFAVRAGWELPAILARLEQVRANTEVVYTLETLEYLARGGRIGRVAAMAGGLLKLKPVIHVEHTDGKYTTVGRGRSISQALGVMTRHLAPIYGSTAVWITVVHGRLPEAADALVAGLRNELNVARTDVLRVSPVLGVHTGPGVVGVAVTPMGLFADLGL
jgi:DegV family protein with EDD domain